MPLPSIIFIPLKKNIVPLLMYMHTSTGSLWWPTLKALSGRQRERGKDECINTCVRGGRGELYAVAEALEWFFTLFNSNEFTRYWLLVLGEATHLVGWAVFSVLRSFLNDANQSGRAWPLSTISFSVILMWWEPEIKHVCVCAVNGSVEMCVLVCVSGSRKTELADRGNCWSSGFLLVMLRVSVNTI